MGTLRVFLADDHAILRDGLKALIEAQQDMCVVGEAASGTVAVEEIARLLPDVAVMDISMPGLNGAEATRMLTTKFPDVGVLALTAHEESGYVQLLLEAGARGYLLKRAAAGDLIRAIRAVAAGQLYLDTTMSAGALAPATEPAIRRQDTSDLSEREAEVLRMVALGFSMKHIAESLRVSPRTLETYRTRAMTKLELTNRADIVRFALQQGWLKDG